jgi:inorganic triphosphatase YgiF
MTVSAPAAAADLAAPSPVEVELKLLAADGVPLRLLARRRRLGPARLGPLTRITEVDRYLDTANSRLAAAGWACRLRTRAGATIVSLKGPSAPQPVDADGGGPATGIHRRPELEGPAGPDSDPCTWPPSGAVALLVSLSGGQPLAERFVLHQRRSQRPVQVGARRDGVLTLDRVRIMHRRRFMGSLWTVELELTAAADGTSGLAASLMAALQAVPGLHPDPLSKLQHAEALLPRVLG